MSSNNLHAWKFQDTSRFFFARFVESVAFSKIIFRARVAEKGKRIANEEGGTYNTPCVHHSRIHAHTRKRRGERSSEEPRFSEEIFPGSHFPGGLARSDSSLVFRRDFIAEKSAFERGRLQVATASRTILPCGACVRAYVCVRVRRFHETVRHYFCGFVFFFLLPPAEGKRIRVALEYLARSRKGLPYRSRNRNPQ